VKGVKLRHGLLERRRDLWNVADGGAGWRKRRGCASVHQPATTITGGGGRECRHWRWRRRGCRSMQVQRARERLVCQCRKEGVVAAAQDTNRAFQAVDSVGGAARLQEQTAAVLREPACQPLLRDCRRARIPGWNNTMNSIPEATSKTGGECMAGCIA